MLFQRSRYRSFPSPSPPLAFYVLGFFLTLSILGIAYISNIQIFQLLLFLFFLLFIFKKDLVILMVIVTIPFRDVNFLQLPVINVRIGDIMLFIALILRLVLYFNKKNNICAIRSSIRSIDFLLFCLVFLSLFSAIWAVSIDGALAKTGRFVRNLLLYILIVGSLRTDFLRYHNQIAIGFCLTGVVSLMRILNQYREGLSLVSFASLASDATSRALVIVRGTGGLFTDINALAMWVITGSYIILSVLPQASKMRWKTHPVFWIGLIASQLTLILTLSRTGWFAFLLSLLFLLWKRRKQIRLSALFGCMVLLGFIGFGGMLSGLGPLVLARFQSSFDVGADWSISARFALWDVAARLFIRSPIIGFGSGLSVVSSPSSVAFAHAQGAYTPFFHNLYLQFAAELGLIGLLLLILIFITSFRRLFQARFVLQEMGGRIFWLADTMAAALVAHLVIGLALTDFTGMDVWILLAVVAAIPIKAGSESKDIIPKQPRLYHV